MSNGGIFDDDQNQRWSDETFSQAQLVDSNGTLNGILSTGKSITVIPLRQRQHSLPSGRTQLQVQSIKEKRCVTTMFIYIDR